MKKAGKKLCHSNDPTGISENQELIMELMLSTKPSDQVTSHSVQLPLLMLTSKSFKAYRVSLIGPKVRITIKSAINSLTAKYCSVAFISIITP